MLTFTAMNKVEFIQKNTTLKESAIQNVIELLEDGATIPFISRYRKERTGGLDELEIALIRDLSKSFNEIQQRKESILKSIEEQGKLSDTLKNKINTVYDLNELEDLYLPFKQKKLTRGEKAKKKGLEPLAKILMSQPNGDPFQMAYRFVGKEVENEEEAIKGAKDIIAEWMNETPNLRARLRESFEKHATLTTKVVKGKEKEAEKYKDYFDYSGALKHCPSHRFLAIYRANREGLLSIKARPDEARAIETIKRFFVKTNNECSHIIEDTCEDTYKRLLRPSLENEVLSKAKDKADTDAIQVFSKNLTKLLLAPPLGAKRILAIDPGFRTGCKVVCLDEQGNLLHNTTIFPHPPQKEASKAKSKIAQLVETYHIDTIAIGDGTAGRETEQLIKHIRFSKEVEVFVVREDGASIYSASPIARKEFPNYDVTVRGAVSIGRRLMDPLAELVKIDPKSIGVGQYQHEVNQTRLKEALDDVVISAVNSVGVDLNTASEYLLKYVSGLGETLAKNIVEYRKENGPFHYRMELKKVKRLGNKAFEQCAGFLRIKNGDHPLDNSAVHPESYALVEEIAQKYQVNIIDLIGNEQILSEVKYDDFSHYDHFTFDDVIKELKKPGLDPRGKSKILEFDHRIKGIEDLIPGMEVNGIVTNVTNFGAFVNIGIKENGLIHKSNLSDTYVEDPSTVISIDEHVRVKVIEVDASRKRIGLKKL